MNKNAPVAALALVVVSGWLVGARAQEASPPGSLKIQTSHEPAPPGQVGGPVENHPELWTPEHLKEETEAVKEYCRTHDCRSAIVEPRPAGYGESIDRANRAWVSSHPSNVAPSDETVCERDPAHPSGPDLCYRASDHSRVYPGAPGKN